MTDHRCVFCDAPYSGPDESCPERALGQPHRFSVRRIEFDHHDPDGVPFECGED